MSSEIAKKTKLKRQVISLEEKIKILDRLKYGEKLASVARGLNLNESTIRTIKENENKIRATVFFGSSMSINRVARIKNTLMAKMENCLMIWIEDCYQKNVPLNSYVIKQKALDIHARLKELDHICPDEQHKSGFRASKGWFERFKNRFSLRSLKMQAQRVSTVVETTSNDMSEDYNYDLIDNDQELEQKVEVEVQIDESAVNIINNDTESSNKMEKNFTLKTLKQGLELANKLETHFINNDFSTERSMEFKRQLQNCLAPYYDLEKALEGKAGDL